MSRSQIHSQLNFLDKAISENQTCKKLIQNDDNFRDTDLLPTLYSTLSENYYRLNQFDKSIECLEIAAKLMDDIIEIETDQSVKNVLLSRQATIFESIGNMQCDLRNFEQS